MNFGVCIKGSCYNDYDKDFYGLLDEIVELVYLGAGATVVLFKCTWFDTERGVRVHPRHGLVKINHKSRLQTNDPFVLAHQAQQVYYTRYPCYTKGRGDWWAVCKTKARGRYDIPQANIESNIHDADDNEWFQEDEPNPVQLIGVTNELDDFRVIADIGHSDEVPSADIEGLQGQLYVDLTHVDWDEKNTEESECETSESDEDDDISNTDDD